MIVCNGGIAQPWEGYGGPPEGGCAEARDQGGKAQSGGGLYKWRRVPVKAESGQSFIN